MPQREKEAVKALVPTHEKGQVVCPKTMRAVPENYIPCVFLGQQGPSKSSKCPAVGWDSPDLLEEDSNRSSMELNNNTECQQWADKCPPMPSKEVGALQDLSKYWKVFRNIVSNIKL